MPIAEFLSYPLTMPSPINRVHRADIVDESAFDLSCKLSFAEIVEKDSPGRRFGFTNDILAMRCIDMDAVEIARSKQLDKTMDCCIGIATLNCQTREYSAHKLLFVELKLNCKNHNLKQEDYKGKIRHTLDLSSEYQHHRKKIFLFQNPANSKAKRDVAHWCRGSNAGELKDVLVLTPEEFNEFIGFEHRFEHIPLTKTEDIIKSVQYASQSADELMNVIDRWKDSAYNFRLRHNIFEAEHIEQTLRVEVLRVLAQFNDKADRELLEMYLPQRK